MRLELKAGVYTFVDAADYETLARWKWGLNNGYAQRTTWDRERQRTGPRIYMHRAIMCARIREVDHIDGDKLNNRRSNLRLATRAQNSHNRGSFAASGFKGVQRNRDKWQAILVFNKTRTCLGTFTDPRDAAAAYDAAAKKAYGSYARLNFT